MNTEENKKDLINNNVPLELSDALEYIIDNQSGVVEANNGKFVLVKDLDRYNMLCAEKDKIQQEVSHNLDDTMKSMESKLVNVEGHYVLPENVESYRSILETKKLQDSVNSKEEIKNNTLVEPESYEKINIRENNKEEYLSIEEKYRLANEKLDNARLYGDIEELGEALLEHKKIEEEYKKYMASKEVSSEIPEDIPEDTKEVEVPEVTEEVPEETKEVEVPEVTEDAPEDTKEVEVPEVTEDVPEKTKEIEVPEVTEDAPEETKEAEVPEVTEDAPEETKEAEVPEVTEDTPEETKEIEVPEVTEDAPEETKEIEIPEVSTDEPEVVVEAKEEIEEDSYKQLFDVPVVNDNSEEIYNALTSQPESVAVEPGALSFDALEIPQGMTETSDIKSEDSKVELKEKIVEKIRVRARKVYMWSSEVKRKASAIKGLIIANIIEEKTDTFKAISSEIGAVVEYSKANGVNAGKEELLKINQKVLDLEPGVLKPNEYSLLLKEIANLNQRLVVKDAVSRV